MSKRYIIVGLDEAKQLAEFVSSPSNQKVIDLVARIRVEAGADIEDIVRQMKVTPFCSTCIIGSSRLSRLVDQANGIVQSKSQDDQSIHQY